VARPSYEQVVLEDIQDDEEILAYTAMSDDYLGHLGYTEHGLRHANLVAHIAGNILRRLGYDERLADLASISGFMHDIGNSVSREFHGVSAAMIAKDVLYRMGMDPKEIAIIMNAVGNHEEEFGTPVGPVAAAAIMADKADVHHTRVRNPDPAAFDIHDRVNHSAKRSFLRVDEATRTITLEIDIDTDTSQVMEYFEIFLSRMQMCRSAAEVLDATFSLVINENKLL
jgi:metal-dependent HD superfamily phosphatase/phosphodiesterase